MIQAGGGRRGRPNRLGGVGFATMLNHALFPPTKSLTITVKLAQLRVYEVRPLENIFSQYMME